MSDSIHTIEKIRDMAREHEIREGWARDITPSAPVLDSEFKIKPAAWRVLKQFQQSHPFQQSDDEWIENIPKLFELLSTAYRMPAPATEIALGDGPSDSSRYSTESHMIMLTGRRSMITALMLFAQSRGYGSFGSIRWAHNVFARFWPTSAKKLRFNEGSCILRRSEHASEFFPTLTLAEAFPAYFGIDAEPASFPEPEGMVEGEDEGEDEI